MTENTNPVQPEPQPVRGRGGAALGGLILIALGATFFLQTLGLLGPHFNWWAIFILIPACSSLWAAWMAYTRGGRRFNAAARGSLSGGLIVLTVALMFLAGADWRVWWPLMVIVPGAAVCLNGVADTDNPSLKALANMNFWIGGTVAGLGGMFLLSTLHVLNLREMFGAFQWWGIFILIPGLGAFLNAYLVFRKSDNRLNAAARGLLTAGLVASAVAVVALLGLDWNLLAPIILIGVGGVLLMGFGNR